MSSAAPVELFISFAHEDEALRQELTKHLAALKRQGIIRAWHDREITAGAEWDGEINQHLDRARIILLLVSPDFMASDYCNDVEVERALARHERGEAVVVPVILRPVDWEGAPFQRLQALPADARPVTSWPNPDEALANVAQGIRKLAQSLAGGGALRPAQGTAMKPCWEMVLSAGIEEVGKARVEAIVAHLRQLTGDLSLTLVEVRPGSVRLILEGTSEAFETIEELFKSGRLIEVEGFKVESVRLVLDRPPIAEPTQHRRKKAAIRPPVKRADGSDAVLPLKVLREAIRAVPAVKYALGVAGIAAAISIVAGFQINLGVAVLGIVVMFGLMTVLVIFSSFARSTTKSLRPLALTLAWTFVALTVGAALFIFTGFFFSWPRPLDQTAAPVTDRFVKHTPTPTPTPRTLVYSILVCEQRTDPTCRKPFTLARDLVFTEGYKIRLNVSSPQPGYLYVINEGPSTSGGLPEYVLLFPTRRVNGGSARIDADRILTFPDDEWLGFDAEKGKEKLWLVWSAEASGDLEAAVRNVFLSKDDLGAITTPGDIVAVRDALRMYSAARPEVRRAEDLGSTVIEGRGGTFAYAVVFDHH